MKIKLLIVFFMFFALTGYSQSVYFVATNGNNSNAGTKAQPFLTIQHGINQLKAGDTLYIRGGVYYITETLNVTASKPYYHSNGTEANPIVVSAYPPDHAGGNPAIIDGINGYRMNNIWIRDISWWKFWGITSRNALQDGNNYDRRGFVVTRSPHIYFEQCVAHNNGGSGFYAEQPGTIVNFTNCDSYKNADTLFTTPNIQGGMARGFVGVGVDEIYFYGCRAWDNSDNGIEAVYSTKKSVFDNSWALRNGYILPGDGRGITIGLLENNPAPPDQYVVKNCISAYNSYMGFMVNSRLRPYQINIKYYNNFEIGNKISGWYLREATDNTNAVVILRNNVSYGRTYKMAQQGQTGWLGDTEMTYDSNWNWSNPNYKHDHNSWNNPNLTLTAADFIGPMNSSSIITAMLAPRKPDGSLPDLPNLWPSETSKLKNAGIDVGLPYYGSAPDLGPFQFNPVKTGHNIIFQIKNNQGIAINNASITFNGVTHQPGVYTLQGIEVGIYNISVAAPGYQTVNMSNYKVEGDATIPVIMTPNNYQINLSANPIAGGSVAGHGTYQYGQTVNITAKSNEGYIFVNWTENGNSVSSMPDYTFTATQNRNLVANFSKQTYTVSLSANPTGGGTLSGAGNYNYNAGVTINAQANSGYTFTNWTENGNVVSNSASYTFTVNKNRNLTANFTQITEIKVYTLSYSSDKNGSILGATEQLINHGENGSTVEAVPFSGYRFVTWNDGNKDSLRTDSNISADNHYIASFELIETEPIVVQEVSIYPVPTKNVLNVDVLLPETFDVFITDNGGVIITQLSTANQGVNVYNISWLSPGVYYLNLVSSKNKITKKFMKSR